ncbi:hypothetical protein EJ08DRAFT_206858 [Tothia fuscella]|uniref:Uncharacterized protein n=1 Tax=Tothia fuscella TaxID=1048955 RepID=A0A9P4NTG6_9PEZI|nr:hypothetical protein EJ08DRAFT_206858 [Tothia fuscella]
MSTPIPMPQGRQNTRSHGSTPLRHDPNQENIPPTHDPSTGPLGDPSIPSLQEPAFEGYTRLEMRRPLGVLYDETSGYDILDESMTVLEGDSEEVLEPETDLENTEDDEVLEYEGDTLIDLDNDTEDDLDDEASRPQKRAKITGGNRFCASAGSTATKELMALDDTYTQLFSKFTTLKNIIDQARMAEAEEQLLREVISSKKIIISGLVYEIEESTAVLSAAAENNLREAEQTVLQAKLELRALTGREEQVRGLTTALGAPDN